ncbi:MAG TPA: YraN family protein [Chloroflexia bacterium]|nr:YraN family protein [Chloroflexia bacterium]
MNKRPQPERVTTGQTGEEVAARYLARQGCAILARNWRANPGEVDIIARCLGPINPGNEEQEAQATLAFIEVRTRHGRKGLAEESISQRKAASMASAAYAYMAVHGLDPETTPWRIDLLAVSLAGGDMASINWVQGAIDEGMLG